MIWSWAIFDLTNWLWCNQTIKIQENMYWCHVIIEIMSPKLHHQNWRYKNFPFSSTF